MVKKGLLSLRSGERARCQLPLGPAVALLVGGITVAGRHDLCGVTEARVRQALSQEATKNCFSSFQAQSPPRPVMAPGVLPLEGPSVLTPLPQAPCSRHRSPRGSPTLALGHSKGAEAVCACAGCGCYLRTWQSSPCVMGSSESSRM